MPPGPPVRAGCRAGVRTPHPQGDGALEGKGPQRRPQRRLDRRLEEDAKAVGGGYCQLQMPLKPALAVRETAGGSRLGALGGGGSLHVFVTPRQAIADPQGAGGGGGWLPPADPPTHIRKKCLQGKNEVSQRGPKLGADFWCTILFAGPLTLVPAGLGGVDGPRARNLEDLARVKQAVLVDWHWVRLCAANVRQINPKRGGGGVSLQFWTPPFYQNLDFDFGKDILILGKE